MTDTNPNMFEPFKRAARDLDPSDTIGRLIIRPARPEDAGAVGRISAEREGGDVDAHAEGVRRALEQHEANRDSLLLVAELDDAVVGFGKARHLSAVVGADSTRSPAGWYLTGVVVDPQFRRQGIGSGLTSARLRWIAERSAVVYYFANAGNRVSIALHERFGFKEVARGPEFAGVTFTGGEGILFRADPSHLSDPSA